MATAATARAQRDQVYCHECHMDWFRDEHGLVCPNEICRSDFVEIVSYLSSLARLNVVMWGDLVDLCILTGGC